MVSDNHDCIRALSKEFGMLPDCNIRLVVGDHRPSVAYSAPNRIVQFFRGNSSKIDVRTSRIELFPSLIAIANIFFKQHGPKNLEESQSLLTRIVKKVSFLLSKIRRHKRPGPSTHSGHNSSPPLLGSALIERLHQAYPKSIAQRIEEIIKGRVQKIQKELGDNGKYAIEEKIDGKDFIIKFHSMPSGLQVYTREYTAVGGFNKVENLISLTGKDWKAEWDIAYTKHRNDLKKVSSSGEAVPVAKVANFRELEIVEKLKGLPYVLEYGTEFYRKDPTKIKATLSHFCRGGTLSEYIKQLDHHTLEERINLALQLAKGVQGIHGRGIVHLDLKPKNVLLDIRDGKPEVRIADFGLSFAEGTTRAFAGTVTHASPEQVAAKNEKASMVVKKSMDIWGLGTIIAELLYGESINIFSHSSKKLTKCDGEEVFYVYHGLRKKMKQNLSKKTLPEPIKEIIDSIIKESLDLDADERPEISKIVQKLEKIRKCAIS